MRLDKVSARFKEKFFSAQILDYDEKSDTMILEGNPKIQETGLQIQATKILFYPNREQMTLSHDAKVEIKTNE